MSGIPSRRRQLIVFLFGMAATAIVVFLITTVGAVRTTQQTNAPKIDNTATTLKLVKDCVLPSGACYKRGQASTAKAVGSINAGTRDVIVATLVCRDHGIRGFEPIARCVDRALALVGTTHR